MSEKDIYSKGKDGLDVPGMGLTRANVEPLDGSGMEKERGYDQDDIEYNKRLAALGLGGCHRQCPDWTVSES